MAQKKQEGAADVPKVGPLGRGDNPKEETPRQTLIIPEEVIEQLKNQIGSDFLNVIQELRDENAALRKENETRESKLMSSVKQITDDVLKVKAASHVEHQRVMPYPTNPNRPKKFAHFERLFAELGVGQKDMVFKRKRYTGALMLGSKTTLNHKGDVISMLYCTNHASPFVEDQPTSPDWVPETAPIMFVPSGESSSIFVPKSNHALQRYLIAHPKNGVEFELEDLVSIATKNMEREKAIFEATSYVYTLFDKNNVGEARNFAAHALTPEVADTLETEILLYELTQAVKDKPELIESYKQDSDYYKYLLLYQKAERLGLIENRNGYVTLTWINKKVCDTVGQSPNEAFATYCKDQPGIARIITDRIGDE